MIVGDINIDTLGLESREKHYCSFWFGLFEYHRRFCVHHPERVRRLAYNTLYTFGDIGWEGLGQ